nr:MAG TPA: hypothetical protein [Bacteriophage sp.]
MRRVLLIPSIRFATSYPRHNAQLQFSLNGVTISQTDINYISPPPLDHHKLVAT